MADNITRQTGGLNQDASPQNQPKNTYRFALNAVEESERGDLGFIGNEESNEDCITLPENYIIIGKCYIGDNETLLFMVHENETSSIIGKVDTQCNYTEVVNDASQADQFDFKVNKQIDTTYRLRRGCEKVVYFTDNFNKPRQINLGKLDAYKDSSGDWDISRFNLIKDVEVTPTFSSVELGVSGNLLSGSYNIGIALLDGDLNSTEVLTVTDTVIIYNDNYNQSFEEILGSTTESSNFYKYSETNKSLIVNVDNLDTSYEYYRLFLIEANSTSGEPSRVTYTNEIPIEQKEFELTGSNTFFLSTVEEVQQVKLLINQAEHIEQVENRLLLGNVKGTNKDLCSYQSLASQITSQIAYKDINLTDINSVGNPKRGTLHLENSMGYMPGEIYAFGIVYVFADGSESPVYHIPGKNPTDTVSQMSSDNACDNLTYVDESCTQAPYWGKDSEGDDLLDTPVRHHRFPLRTEVGYPLITRLDTTIASTTYRHTAKIRVYGRYNLDFATSNDYDGFIYMRVKYRVFGDLTEQTFIGALEDTFTYDGEPIDWEFQLPTFYSANPLGYMDKDSEDTDDCSPANNCCIPDSNLELTKPDGTNDNYEDALKGAKNVGWTVTSDCVNEKVINKVSNYETRIFGITFDNITLPIGATGYYITRMERDDANRTIVDSAIITPLLDEEEYTAFNYFKSQVTYSRYNTEYFAFTNPEFKYKGKELNFTEVVVDGVYTELDVFVDEVFLEDASPGTSYNKETAKRREKDEDGFTLHNLNRYWDLSFNTIASTTKTVTENFYLKATVYVKKGLKKIFNVTSDNQTGILKVDSAFTDVDSQIPYVYLKKNVADPYGLFRLAPYYKEHVNIQTGTSTTVFNGDTYVSSMSLTNSIFFDTRLRLRGSKTGIWRIIGGSLLILAGIAGAIAATVFTGGVGVPAAIQAASFGISLLSAGITQANIKKTYEEEYAKGLQAASEEVFTNSAFLPNPQDDEIQWIFDTLGNVFFESKVNMNWRVEPNYGPQMFKKSPVYFDPFANQSYNTDKISVIDSENESGRLYQGFATSEIYKINKDYERRNKEKLFFPLGIEYDCCTDCQEEFPNRVHWSEQSFQEELSDNFTNFLANNYRDIEGNTGPITDLFRIQNNLYIHTEEGLWHLPQNIQERVTGDVVSFIGTGNYFSIPPRRIVDDSNGNSAGTQHKWATIKTPYGVFFVSEKQGVVYQFNGNNLVPISNKGLYNWFKNHITGLANLTHLETKKRKYPYLNNPSNPFGEGFISTYDSRKERIILTKKDLTFKDTVGDGAVTEGDYAVNYHNGNLYLFENYEALIADGLNTGYVLVGFVNNELTFKKYIPETGFTIFQRYYPDRVIQTSEINNNSWTLSFSLRKNNWISWHSYMPNIYFNTPDKVFSWNDPLSRPVGNVISQHNILGKYQTFYNVLHPFMVEYVSLSNAIISRTWESIKLLTEAKQYDFDLQEFVDKRYITFNKGMFYNSRQNSGDIDLIVKDTQANPIDYLSQQVVDNTNNSILLDRNERDWSLNELRDLVTDYSNPMFISNIEAIQTNYYIDKILNNSVVDYDKSWMELESFRDKYLAIRLIFDNFDNIKLLLNYSIENEISSPR